MVTDTPLGPNGDSVRGCRTVCSEAFFGCFWTFRSQKQLFLWTKTRLFRVKYRNTARYVFLFYSAVFGTKIAPRGKYRAVEDEWKITL